MNRVKKISKISWMHVVKLCALVGMAASLWVTVAATSRLWTDPSVRIYPLAWMFGLGLGPFMLLFCWRLFALRLWAGIVICLLGWILINDLLTSPVATHQMGLYTFLCIGVTLVLSMALLAGRKTWKAGL